MDKPISSLLAMFGYLVAEFIGPKKVYTFSSMRDHDIPRSVKCTQSATKAIKV